MTSTKALYINTLSMDTAKRIAFILFPLSLREIVLAIGVFLVYFITAHSGLYIFYTFETSPALIWPPVGIALVAVIYGGYRMWLPIFLAQLIAFLMIYPQLFTIGFVIAAGFALQAVVALYVLRRFNYETQGDSQRNLFLLVGVALFATAVEPVIATLAQMGLGTLTVNPLYNFGRAWGSGIFSVLIIAPFVTSWYNVSRNEFSLSLKEWVEIVGALGLLTIVSYLIFWTSYVQMLGIAVIFVLPAVLVWIALRLHPRWMTASIMLSALIGIAGTLLANPSTNGISTQLLAVQIYVAFVAAIFLIFAAVVEERRSAFRRLERAYMSSTAADKAKNDFIAILAHELRNPLSPIVSSLELLKLEPQTEDARAAIHSAEKHAGVIRRLLDDLLDTARLTQLKFKMHKEVINVGELITQSVTGIQETEEIGTHTIEVLLPQEEMLLHADPTRLSQIVTNLLTNACKYTKPGGTIRVLAERREGYALIEVSDTGIGIAPHQLSEVFEPFKQLDDERHPAGGLGIGLYLTKHLVELQGGKILAASEGPGHGSTFSVYLPLMDVETVRRQTASQPETRAPLEQKKVLIVDDNQAAADSLGKLLQIHGHEIKTSYSGGEALQTVEQFKPSVILLDLGMPDMDGYEVAQKLRSRGWDGKIVALSGYGQDSDRKRSQKEGFSAHLVKPVRVADIQELLVDTKV